MSNSRLEQLHRFLEETPDDPFLLYAIATEYQKTDVQQALNYYEKLVEQHPEYPGTYYHLALLYIDTEDFTKAKLTFEKGIEQLKKLNEGKLLKELESAYQNFLFEYED